MKKKLPYAILLIACISLFSFREVCHGNEETLLKNDIQKEILPVASDKDCDLSPFYNFLKI